MLLFAYQVFAQSADPTKPFSYSVSSSSKTVKKAELVLQTIVESGEEKRVVINGQLLSVGDRILQYKLAKITSRYALLSSPEKNMKLSLFSLVVVKSK